MLIVARERELSTTHAIHFHFPLSTLFTKMPETMSTRARPSLHTTLLLAGTILIAIISARPYAGAWNDGSRLATVESLVDYHTWSIDQSVFVRTPGIVNRNGDLAYADPLMAAEGTMDKMFINDHYYSDKSPVPAVIMAGVYKALQAVTGLSAAGNPRLFCYLMALIFGGGAYVVSVWCMDATAALLGLAGKARLLLAWSFAIATTALPYARQVNNHILLLAVFSAIMFFAVSYAQPGGDKMWRLAVIGSLMGIGYTIDLGAGPVLVLGVAGFVAARKRSADAVALTLIMAFPWFAMHHLLNYKIGGHFKPSNAVAEYFLWPGSPFNAANLTGGWAHKNAIDFVVYTLSLLFGKRGFVGHDIALYLCLPATVLLLRNKIARSPLVWCSLFVIAGTWLLYAATSNNSSGVCCSIRWFVPLLAPFYCLLAVFLKQRPEFFTDLLILSAWGAVMGGIMWFHGPWTEIKVAVFVPLQAAALASWLGWRKWKVKVESGMAQGSTGSG